VHDNYNLGNIQEFDNHKLITHFYDNRSGLHGFIAIHRGNGRHPSFGATRLWDYSTEQEALKDALRLSRAMSYKAAISGLKYGGAKAVLIKNGNINKEKFLRSYAEKVNFLSGNFITGTDVGISDDDVKKMRRRSKYFVGIKTEPARYTGLGVYYALEACMANKFGETNLNGKSIAIQGVGKTGSELLKLVYDRAAKVYVADIDKQLLKKIKVRFPKVITVDPQRIHLTKVDIFAPCALNHVINEHTISKLKCSIICGSANNQLENESLSEALRVMGIVYAPDFVANAGGLISVVDEYEYGNYRIKRVQKRIKIIKKNMNKILSESKQKSFSTDKVARGIAQKTFNHYD
jgi:leucine dehydrogenase